MSSSIIKAAAALNGQKGFKGFAYFFNAKQYIKYDWKKNTPLPGYPKNLSLWKLPASFGAGIDAAINGEKKFDGSAYLFKGNEYLKYDWAKDAPMSGYPKSLSLWNLSGNFDNGIDAAFNGREKFQGCGYFFKNDEYAKYDWSTGKAVPGYPKSLSLWNLPPSFLTGIDAALNGDGKYKKYVYFFKNDEYVRYDWQTGKTSSPKPIRESWNFKEVWKTGTPNTDVKKKALIVFIENTGQLPLPSGTPKWIEDNLEMIADYFFEEIEKAINDFEKSEGSLYDKVIMLEDETAILTKLQSQIHSLAKNGYLIDIIIQAHGNSSSFAGYNHISITDSDIESIGSSFGKPLPIRAVYQMNCKGSGLNDEWRKIGATVVSGADKDNCFPEPLMSSFWDKWKSGKSFNKSVNGAYAELGGYLSSFMAISTTIADVYKESKPIISGSGSVKL